MKKNRKLYLFIPLISSLFFTALFFTRIYTNPDHAFYDMLLRVKPAVEEDQRFLLLNIDDLSISKVGMFPWSRHIMADSLIIMREFGAEYALFDIEYTENSPMGVNDDFLRDDLPSVFGTEFSLISESVGSLFGAIQSGRVALDDTDIFIEDFYGFADSSKERLLQTVNQITRDNDDYLGRAAAFFGKTFFTVNMLPEIDPDVSADAIDYAREHIALKKLHIETDWPHRAVGIRPAIYPIISRASGAGFPTIVIDRDGVRRRINLLMEYDGKVFPQLAFSPLLDMLGNPELTVSDRRIILADALLPGGGRTDIRIPLDNQGSFLINWPKKDFDDSFRSLPFYYLVLHRRQEDALIKNLAVMEEAGYFTYYQENPVLLDTYRQAESMKQEVLAGGDGELIERYISNRAAFFKELEVFLESNAEQKLNENLDQVLAIEGLTTEQLDMYTQIKEQVEEYYAASRTIFAALMETRKRLREELPGSFCIIGWTGTATTDRGVNPFDETYDNVGTHAAVANTILNRDFLDEAPGRWSVIIAWIGAFGIYFIIRKTQPLPSLLLGAGGVLFVIAAEGLFFILARTYVGMTQPVLAAGATFALTTVIKFLNTAKEKSYIKNAFGHYLSTDVINQLMDNPDRLRLGGEKKYMTAVFTDVKGFSTISEKLDPTELVRLLNHYLTVMSDIILDLKGTIDKYEGDAIIAFFGAPIPLVDHAERACLAAVRMKQAEAEFNERFIKEGLAPSPLLTRIGINSGDMVVGNMGTERKMDYTIMGNAVNLAARLEGVNKQYGTWMLMSDASFQAGGKKFLTRRLDRVRVVGIHEPVRLHQVVGIPEEIDKELGEAIEVFHRGLDLFEEREWTSAGDLFRQVLDALPGDGPAEKYLNRCKEYMAEPPKPDWDGVYNLTEK